MSRKQITQKHPVQPDIRFNSETVGKLINYLMLDGKKETTRRAVYQALDEVARQLKVEDPLEILETAIKNAGPTMEVRSKRVGGANYQVPREVRPSRRQALSMKWIIEAARKKSGTPISRRLAGEIVAAYNNEGDAVNRREQAHRMAEANKAFAHFSV